VITGQLRQFYNSKEVEAETKEDTNMKNYLRNVTVFILLAIPATIYANCDVIDVIDMYDDEGMSKSEVRNECDNKVSDAPNCSVRKVIRFYDDGYDEDEIATKCSSSNNSLSGPGYGGGQQQSQPQSQPQSPQPQISNICQTSMSWCALGQSAPIGTPCWCNSGFGPLNGQIVPR